MSAKTKLKHSLLQVLKHDRQGSFATRYDRRSLLQRFSEDLVKMGYKVTEIRNIRLKHIEAVTAYWSKENLSNATIKKSAFSFASFIQAD